MLKFTELMIHYTVYYVQSPYVFFTFKNPAIFEKYLALASFTFFSAACGFTISKPCNHKYTFNLIMKIILTTKFNIYIYIYIKVNTLYNIYYIVHIHYTIYILNFPNYIYIYIYTINCLPVME